MWSKERETEQTGTPDKTFGTSKWRLKIGLHKRWEDFENDPQFGYEQWNVSDITS